MFKDSRPFPTPLLLLGFLILPLLLYANVTFGSKTMLPVDNLYQFAPWAASAAELGVGPPHNGLISDLILQNYVWKSFVRESLAAGELPLWNPHLFAGVPFLAAGQHSAYYPFSILFLIMPLAKAYGWYTLIQIWLAGVLMYGYGRILNLSRGSAFLAGLVFQGCGTLVISAAVFPMVSGAMIWLPLLLGCIEKIIHPSTTSRPVVGQSGWRILLNLPTFWLLLGAVVLGVQILAGHIEYTIYTLLVMGLYGLWRLLNVAWGRGTAVETIKSYLLPNGLRLLGMVTLGMMLGGIQLIPLYELGQVNFREASSTLDEIRFYGFQERRVVTLALPNFFGNPTHHSYRDLFTGQTIPFELNYEGNPKRDSAWGFKNYVEGAIYLGILPLVLAGIAVWRRWRDGRIQFFVLLSLASLAFIFGTPLYAILFYGLPFVNQLHTPFRWVFPLSVCVAVLAGFGAEEIGVRRQVSGVRKPSLTIDNVAGRDAFARQLTIDNFLPFTLFAGALALLLTLAFSFWQYGRIALLIDRLFLGLALATSAFPSAEAFFSYQFWQLLTFGMILLGCGVVLWLGFRQKRRPFYIAAAALIIIDLFLANRGFNTAVDASLLDHKPELVQWLEQQPGQWRLTSYNPRGDNPLIANGGWFYGFEDIRGYDSIIPKQFTTFMAAIENQGGLIYNRIQPIHSADSLNSPLLDVLNVKYIITSEQIENPKFALSWEGEGVRVYENLGVAPRAYTLPQSATVVVDDPLVALREFDPRRFVVVSEGARSEGAIGRGGEGARGRGGEGATAVFDYPLSVIRYPLRDDLKQGGSDSRQLTINSQQSTVSSQQSTIHNSQFRTTFGRLHNSQFRTTFGRLRNLQSLTPATITRYTNREVIVETAVSTPSWLILNDSYFPGWNAFVRPQDGSDEDEVSVEIFRVNGNFRGVLLEPGAWTVRYRYSPSSFWLGGLTTLMGVIIVLFTAVVSGWRQLTPALNQNSLLQSLAKNSVAPMVLNLFNKGIDFAFALYYLRVLGPANAGSYQTAITTAVLFEIISNFGLDILLIRDVSQARENGSSYLLNSSILRLGLGAMAALPIAIFIFGTQEIGNSAFTRPEIWAIAFIMLGMVFSGMSKGITGLFYVYEQAEIPAAMATISTILKVGFGVAALLLGYGFVGLAAVSILTNIITLTILSLIANRRFDISGPWQIDWPLQREMVQKGWPLMLIHLLQTVFISIDVLLLKLQLPQTGQTVVGWYSTAYKWFNALQIIPSFFTLALFPVISRELKNSVERARQMYQLSLKLMLLLALPIAAVIFYLAYPLTRILSGTEFLPHGAIALQIVILSIPFGWLNSVTNYVLIGLGLEGKQPRAFAIAVGFNIITNLIFIPLFTYRAAAVTTILSELVLMVIFAYYLRQKRFEVDWRGLMTRPFLLTALMFAGLYLGGLLHAAVGLLAGGVIFVAGLFLFNILGQEERRVLAGVLPAPIARRLG